MMVSDRYFSTQNFDSTFKWASPEIFGITGYNCDEIVGRNPYEFFHHDDLSRIVKKHMAGVGIIGDGIQKLTYRFRRKDGKFIWCQVCMTSYDGGLMCVTRKLKFYEWIILKIKNISKL